MTLTMMALLPLRKPKPLSRSVYDVENFNLRWFFAYHDHIKRPNNLQRSTSYEDLFVSRPTPSYKTALYLQFAGDGVT